jgi:high-affinity iron transporter
LLVWQGLTAAGNPNPLEVSPGSTGSTAAALDIGVLVFREGLECILVLAAVTAGTTGVVATYRQPISVGVGVAGVCTLITWRVAVSVLDDLTGKMSALTLQAVTGLVAVLVLLMVMNWFFHKVYWSGWISMHTKKRQALLLEAKQGAPRRRALWLGFGLLGFTSFYREGFEVVLFLQSYRMKLGGRPVFYGVLIGLTLSSAVAVLTFVAHRRLPYRKMRVLTGIMLGGVLLVMVGEQTQEMQLAQWLPTTNLPALARIIPPWSGLWLSIFPTVETLTAQFIAAGLVISSYFLARPRIRR